MQLVPKFEQRLHLQESVPSGMWCCMQFPTFRAYPLQPECDNWCEFPVKDRPNAVVQWLMAAEQHPELIQGAWLLMLESDYVWMKPLTVREIMITFQALGTPHGNERQKRPGAVL